jgi:hypothetical protein
VPPRRVALSVDGQELAQAIRVERDPNQPSSLLAEEPEIAVEETSGQRPATDLRFRRIDD